MFKTNKKINLCYNYKKGIREEINYVLLILSHNSVMDPVVIIGEKCILAEGREQFAEHIASFSNNYKIWRFTSDNFAHPYLKEHALAFIEASKTSSRGIFFIIYTATDKNAFSLPLDYSKLEAVGGIMFKQSNASANVKHINEIG